MASTVTVTAERSASGGTLRNDRVSQRRPDWPSVGSSRLSMVEPKSKTDPPGYCKLALQTDQLDPSNKVKQTSTFTCLPSRQARSARTSMPFVDCIRVTGADSIVGYDGSMEAVGPA